MDNSYLAADTIFIDWVIFWMFLTDFRRIEIIFSVAMPRCCWSPFISRQVAADGPTLVNCWNILMAA